MNREHLKKMAVGALVCIASASLWFGYLPGSFEADDGRVLALAPVQMLTHDFGVVGVSEKLTHSFVVKNDSWFTWKLVHINSNCGCAVAKASRHIILAGSSETIDVSYTSPSNVADDHKIVSLKFDGEDTRQVNLHVLAKIRKPLSLFPSEIAFGALRRGAHASKSVLVENYSKQDWLEIKLSERPAWLNCSSPRLLSADPYGAPRQVWGIDVSIHYSDELIGWHGESLGIEVDRVVAETQFLRISVDVRAPLLVVPTPIVFQRAFSGQATETRIVFESQPKFLPGDVKVTCTVPFMLGLALNVKTDHEWILTTRIPPQAIPKGLHKGTINLRFPEGSLPVQSIPIFLKSEIEN